ncbi:MAG TPA: hypothetical protein VHN11_11835 [Xanthobacteraceae bacterium]|jgi:hypothetical protein|nr:hypothetical protein [Xanthobacteraceae bacterium]
MVRSFIAIAIAFSIAVLPVASGYPVLGVAQAETQDVSATEELTDSANAVVDEAVMADMAMTDSGMSDCCPHKNDIDKVIDGCCAMVVCPLKCFNFMGAAVSALWFPSASAKLELLLAIDAVASRMESPPFRPPRV